MTSDPDPTATQEWLDAFDSVMEFDGADRAAFLLEELVGAGPAQRGAGAVLGDHAVSEHDPAARAAAAPG